MSAENSIRRIDLTPAAYRRSVPQACLELLKPSNPDAKIQDLQATAEMILAILIASVENALEEGASDPETLVNLGRTLGALENAANIVENLPFIQEPAMESED